MSNMNLVEAFRQTLPAAQTDADGKIRRPPEIDASTLKRLYFIRPLIGPCTQTTLSNLNIIERAMPGVDFYRNGSGKAPEDRWSDLLDMDLNNAHVVMHDLFANMKHYHGGDSPFHFDCFRQMQFTTRALISFLIDAFGQRSTPFERSLKLWDLAIVSLTKAQAEHVDDGAWCRDIDRFEGAIFESFVANCRFLKSLEYNATIPRPVTVADLAPLQATATDCKSAAESADRKADALLAVADETAATVKRIDRRTKSDHRKRLFTIEQQERCFHYWEIGKNKTAIKSAAKGKVTKGAVFAYFKKELTSLGINSEKDFSKSLTLRSKRISKEQSKK